MKVAVLCETSGVVRDAFRGRGHDAWSIDIEEPDVSSPYHLQEDFNLIPDDWFDQFDLLIGHPPCRYLSNAGVWKLHRDADRWIELRKASDFFWRMWGLPVPKICIENPIPHKYGELPRYSQTIQPWQFGEDASKRTCLWLKGLPFLQHTKVIKKKRYANQTPSGQNKLGPSKNRAKIRAKTYPGIAKAMAEQWGE